ncbi:MAG: histidine kinase, gyrase and HSP90-like ATPase family protein [Rhodocyclales bacterium]|nr:histidine kinase, gyrase and HSP90-like ATPase family protein [Rhodocyclales bacterium]
MPEASQQKTARFDINAALFEELGERLVSKPEVALAELVKNAYDADATSCQIRFGDDQIIVEDNGHGMSEEQFLRFWMVVSTQEKGLARFSRKYRRNMAGSKGVGRFSARYLGHALTLISVADTTASRMKLTATFDWRAITRESSISTVTIPYVVEEVPPGTPSGTTLVIDPLRLEARSISVSKIKTDIVRLTDPVAGLEIPPFSHEPIEGIPNQVDPGFSVVILGSEADGEDTDVQLLQKEILDRYVGRVRIKVDGDNLNYQVFWRDHEGAVVDHSFKLSDYSSPYTHGALAKASAQHPDSQSLLADIPYLPVSQSLHSPVFLDLRFFPRRPGTFAGLDLNGKVAGGWIRDHAGISIVDNRFAMAAYADQGSDWLALNADSARNERNWQSIFTPALYPMTAEEKLDPALNPMLALPSGRQVLGRVHIATRRLPKSSDEDRDTDDWLQPNMDRESLRNNGAFRLLWHITRFGTELLALFDRRFRLEEEEAARLSAESDAQVGFTQAISDIRESPEIAPEYRNRIIRQLEAVKLRYEESAGYERGARVSLELMSMMGVMAGFMTHEFEKAMHTLQSAAIKIRKLAQHDPQLSDAADDISALEASLASHMDYMRLFVNRARRPHPQEFKADAQIRLVLSNLRSLAEPHAIAIDVQSPASLPGPYVAIAAYHGILINLISNAMKALVPKVSSEQRKILILVRNEATKHVLVCADNGIGIADYLKTRIWDPLFTTTGDGTNPLGSGLGLGLSVVRQVVGELDGSIELMQFPPDGYITAFKVVLPLQGSIRT